MAPAPRDPFVEWLERQISDSHPSDAKRWMWMAVEVLEVKMPTNPAGAYCAYTTMKGEEGTSATACVYGEGNTPMEAASNSVQTAIAQKIHSLSGW